MNRVRVLLAEDSPRVARQLSSLLATEFEVIGIAEDGVSLVRLAGEMHPDVVVTDIAMPGMNGLDAAEQLRGRDARLGLVFITVHADRQLVERAMGLNECAYVLKSDAGEDLLAAVRAVMAGGSFLSPSLAGPQSGWTDAQ
jgi:DNA-binding NarL/FixJ family response regulator